MAFGLKKVITKYVEAKKKNWLNVNIFNIAELYTKNSYDDKLHIM